MVLKQKADYEILFIKYYSPVYISISVIWT